MVFRNRCPQERDPALFFLTAIIFQTMQLGKRRNSQGKVWELAVSFTLITKIQIRIPQRRGMLDQDRLSSPREVTKEGEQRPFKSLWKTALWLHAWSEHVQKCFKILISRKSGTTKFPLPPDFFFWSLQIGSIKKKNPNTKQPKKPSKTQTNKEHQTNKNQSKTKTPNPNFHSLLSAIKTLPAENFWKYHPWLFFFFFPPAHMPICWIPIESKGRANIITRECSFWWTSSLSSQASIKKKVAVRLPVWGG